MTRFYCFINGKIKKEPEKRAILCFSVGSGKFYGKQRILRHNTKIHMPRNTAGPDHQHAATRQFTQHSLRTFNRISYHRNAQKQKEKQKLIALVHRLTDVTQAITISK